MRRALAILFLLQAGVAAFAAASESVFYCGEEDGVVLDLSTAGASGSLNGAIFQQVAAPFAENKLIEPFARIQRFGCEEGYNTSVTSPPMDVVFGPSHDLLLTDVPIVSIAGEMYRQVLLRVQENPGDEPLLLMDLRIYQSNAPILISEETDLAPYTPIYDIDAASNRHILLRDVHSGNADYVAYIPNNLFGAEPYVHLFCKFAFSSDGFEEWFVVKPFPGTPTANAGGPYLGAINTSISFNGGASSDPDGDALTYAWSFGDGGTGTGVAPTHTYLAPDVYDVCLTVSDAQYSSDPHCTIAVAYDPEAGFVSGGGWFNSPQGAYKSNPDATGRATFGFLSKYKRGASVPNGETHFQFSAGDLNFNSAAYSWLVVNQSGSNAQFMGTGAINGAMTASGSPYKFMVWATDASPDRFRIRIWEEDASGFEQDVYDNGVSQAIDAGSIVVQTGSKKASAIAGAGAQLRLGSASPNPFHGSTRVHYAVGVPEAKVDIAVFDVTGRRVRSLVSGVRSSGSHTVSWDGRSDRGERVAKGVYFLVAQVGDQKQTMRVAHLR